MLQGGPGSGWDFSETVTGEGVSLSSGGMQPCLRVICSVALAQFLSWVHLQAFPEGHSDGCCQDGMLLLPRVGYSWICFCKEEATEGKLCLEFALGMVLQV